MELVYLQSKAYQFYICILMTIASRHSCAFSVHPLLILHPFLTLRTPTFQV